jgi:hypothetical protein
MTGRTSTGESLRDTWQSMLTRVLTSGTRVLVLDDEFDIQGQAAKPPWSQYTAPVNSVYCYVRRTDRPHYIDPTSNSVMLGTNTDSSLVTEVLDFLRGGSCPPSR